MKKLFILCPECHLEQHLRDEYGEDIFFISALGTQLSLDEFCFAEEINQFLGNEDIGAIYIVNNLNCTFIEHVVAGDIDHNLDVEITLNKIAIESKTEIGLFHSKKEKTIKLIELNFYSQVKVMLDSAFIGDKIKEGEINLIGVLFDAETKTFKEMQLSFT